MSNENQSQRFTIAGIMAEGCVGSYKRLPDSRRELDIRLIVPTRSVRLPGKNLDKSLERMKRQGAKTIQKIEE